MRKRASKFLSLFLVLAMVCSLFGSAMAAEEETVTPYEIPDVDGKIVILHTNDTHGADVASEASIGTAGVAQLKKDFEAAGAEVLLFSAGDAIQGAPIVNYDHGASEITFMNAAGYDAMSLGNHEFDWGYENLVNITASAEFPILCANVVDKETGEPVFEANHIFQTENGLKVGVFGLETPETATKTNPKNIEAITFLGLGDHQALYDCAQEQVDALTEAGADLIVCLGHLGINDESAGMQSIDVVNNVTGANGSIALTQYKDDKTDGYTLIGTNAMSLASNEASGLSDFGYDAFEVISVYGKQCGENLLVRADAPYNTLEELIAATQKESDSITLGVAMGGSSYIAGLIMQMDNDAKFAMVDAGGDGAERMTSLLGGHIDVTIAPYTLAKEYIESGKVKSLCTLMSERLPATPDIPTALESGVPNLKIDTLYVLLAPKGTPKEIVDKLNAAVLDIVNNDPEYKEAIMNFNFQEPYALNVEDSIARLKEQREHMMSYAKYLQ